MVRVPRAVLIAAVRPHSLPDTLASLLAAGVIDGYEITDGHVTIHGDRLALERAMESLDDAPEPTVYDGRRQDYFAACTAYTHVRSFRKLPANVRAVWRLHANGASRSRICELLGLSPATVRGAVERTRMAAGLARSTSSMPRGGGTGRPRRLGQCRDCERPARAQGLCPKHYQRELRRRRNQAADCRVQNLNQASAGAPSADVQRSHPATT